MTVEVASRRTRKPKVSSPAQSLAIGEIDQTVFACPACARPLALGARHCPGCGTRLLLGVQARKASIFAGAGLVAGVVVAIVFTSVASAIGQAFGGAGAAAAAAAVATPTADATPQPTLAPTAGATPTTSAGTTSIVPGLSRSALGQAAAVDDRLAGSGAALAAALDAATFDTVAVAQVLRAMSADAVVGLQMSTYIGAWPGGKRLSDELTSFYSGVQQVAAEGLSASIRNDDAYQAAAQRMVDLLAGLDELDGHVRQVASDAGVTLAPAGAPAP